MYIKERLLEAQEKLANHSPRGRPQHPWRDPAADGLKTLLETVSFEEISLEETGSAGKDEADFILASPTSLPQDPCISLHSRVSRTPEGVCGGSSSANPRP